MYKKGLCFFKDVLDPCCKDFTSWEDVQIKFALA